MEESWVLNEAAQVVSLAGIKTAILRHGKIPVAVGLNNSAPELTSCETGETTLTRPFVLVNVLEAHVTSGGTTTAYVCAVSISANGKRSSQTHQRKAMSVVELDYQRSDSLTPEDFAKELQRLAPEIDRAIHQCEQIDELFAEAALRTAIIRAHQSDCVTREGYESACTLAGVEAIADTEIFESYGIKYGVFTYPDYDPDHIVRMGLAAARLHALNAEQKSATSQRTDSPCVTEVAVQGQIWEPCEKCGNEPSYLPMHLCLTCWPKLSS